MFSDSIAQVITWNKLFGGSGAESINSVISLSDGNYLFTSNTYSFPGSESDIYVAKKDKGGHLLWGRHIDHRNDDNPKCVIECSDNSILIVGESFESGNRQTFLLKLDADGNKLWFRTFELGGGNVRARSVIETQSGDYLVVGEISAGGQPDVFAFKTDENGILQWSKKYGGAASFEAGYNIIEVSNNRYLIAGINHSGVARIYLVSIDKDGNLNWTKSYADGGNYFNAFIQIAKTFDNKVLLFVENTTGPFTGAILKIDTLGNQLWARTVNDLRRARGILSDHEDQYIFHGSTLIFGGGGEDNMVFALDSSGNFNWAKSYGTTRNERAGDGVTQSLKRTSDGGLIFLGGTDSSHHTGVGSEYIIYKTDDQGNVGCNFQSHTLDIDTPVFNEIAVDMEDTLLLTNILLDSVLNDLCLAGQFNCMSYNLPQEFDTIICIGEDINIQVDDAWASYDWSSGDNTPNLTISPTDSMTYTLIVNANTCSADTFEYTVLVSADSLDAGRNDTIMNGDTIQLNASSNTSIMWEQDGSIITCLDCLDPLVSPNQTTTYVIQTTDTQGCIAIDSVIIVVLDTLIDTTNVPPPIDTVLCDLPFIPNAIISGSTAANYVLNFTIENNGYVINEIKVFDSKGAEVAMSGLSTGATSWSAIDRITGEVLNRGVYLYYIEATCVGGETKYLLGNISVL